MNQGISKECFMKKLKFYLAIYFDGEESRGILQDYEDWFANEARQGKTEEEICRSLRSPKKVVGNLLAESGERWLYIGTLLQNTIVQTVLLLAAHGFASIFLLKTCGRNGYSYFYFALALVFIFFALGIALVKAGPSAGLGSHRRIFSIRGIAPSFNERPGRWPLRISVGDCTPTEIRRWNPPPKRRGTSVVSYRSNLPVFGFAMAILLCQIAVLPNLKGIYSGKVCFWLLLLLIAALYPLCFLAASRLNQSREWSFVTTLHISGVITLLFYTINQLNMLYTDAAQFYTVLVGGSMAIYLETVLLCYIFYKRKRIRE